MEYEVNQVLITPLGGDLEKPLYMYQAHLYVVIRRIDPADIDSP